MAREATTPEEARKILLTCDGRGVTIKDLALQMLLKQAYEVGHRVGARREPQDSSPVCRSMLSAESSKD